MVETLEAVEEALGLSGESPADTEILFPEHRGEYKLLDDSTAVLNIRPWGLGRFVQAQAELGAILVSFPILFKELDLDKFDESLSTELLTQLLNLIMPHIQTLLLITLSAEGTFKEMESRPPNIRRFVDELPLSIATQIITVVMKQNWRHIKNVLGLAEMKALAKAISAGQSNS